MGECIEISIIVPVYKVEKYLPKCLDSILAQTFSDFEVLLVDDGSPDSSGRIAEEYAERDSRIKVFHKENGGVSSARNYGLRHARGQYIAFCDSDDWVEADWLETLYQQMNTYSADLSVCGMLKENEAGKILFSIEKDQIYVKNKEEILLTLFKGDEYNKYQGWIFNKLYKRKIIMQHHISFKEDVFYSEDRLFNFFYYCYCTSAVFSTSSKYHYLIRQNSAMISYQESNAYEEKYGSFMDAFEIMSHSCRSFPLVIRQALASNYILDCINLYIKYNTSASQKEIHAKVKAVIGKNLKLVPGLKKREYFLFLIHPSIYKNFIYIRWKLSKIKHYLINKFYFRLKIFVGLFFFVLGLI